MSARILAVLIVAVLAGCATPNSAVRHDASCGSLPPPFHAPVLCPSVDKNTRTLEIWDETAYGFRIEREADTHGGLRIPPQTVIPFVRPSHEELE
jgi:uncharacterized protein YceK